MPPPTSRRCWVSRATVYRHLAVDAVSRKAAPDIRAQVHATAVAALDFLTSDPRLVQLLLRSHTSEVLQQARLESARAIGRAMAALINKPPSAGAHELDSEMAAYALVSGAMEVIPAGCAESLKSVRVTSPPSSRVCCSRPLTYPRNSPTVASPDNGVSSPVRTWKMTLGVKWSQVQILSARPINSRSRRFRRNREPLFAAYIRPVQQRRFRTRGPQLDATVDRCTRCAVRGVAVHAPVMAIEE